MNSSLKDFAGHQLQEIENAGLLRSFQNWQGLDGRLIRWEGKELINFSSNDYLGIASHPKMSEFFQRAVWEGPFGSMASRLISGNHQAHRDLEAKLASFKGSKAALVFTSGYAAAVGTIPTIVGERDFVVMDKLCHASLVDGARLSGAEIRVFPHNNVRRCCELLETCRSKNGGEGRILLITESVFSMNGDLSPLGEISKLKKDYGAWLMVDEAHGTGVLGKEGRGGAEYFGVESEVDISLGTLSKVFGCVGGYVCGCRELIDLLINRARSLIFSTGLPGPVCRVAGAAIDLMRNHPQLREKLWKNIHTLGQLLDVKVDSPIVPIPIGDEGKCMEAALRLREKGFAVPGVRFPAVGRGKARLRVSVSAAHTQEDVHHLVNAIRSLGLLN